MSERYMTEAEMICRVHVCAGEILAVSEKLRGRPYSAGRYRALFEKTKRSVFKYFERQFVIVYDPKGKVRKNPR